MLPRRHNDWRPTIVNGSLVLGSLMLALVITELGLRVLLSPKKVAALPHAFVSENIQSRLRWQGQHISGVVSNRYGFDAPDPLLGWRLRPNVTVRSAKEGSYDVLVRANEMGLRGAAPVQIAKPTGTIRIGIFGDSQTFGEGVNDHETYSVILAENLSGVDVLNFGVHGYGTDQMLLRYETEGIDYKLDVLILAFAQFHMLRNDTDFSYFAKPRFELLSDGKLRLTGVPVPSPEELAQQPVPYTWQFADESVLARWVWKRVQKFRERTAYKPGSLSWQLTKALITRFATTARKAGTDFIIVNIDKTDPEIGFLVEGLAKEIGVGFLDLRSMFQLAHSSGPQYWLQNDGHWNALGHRLVATELKRYLCSFSKYSEASCQTH